MREAAITLSRVACGMSPCSAFASKRSASDVLSSSHSAFVAQKTIARPALGVTASAWLWPRRARRHSWSRSAYTPSCHAAPPASAR